MPITSVGYEGTVNEAQWAELIALAGGRQYGVAGAPDWKVAVGGADRQVRVAAGRGFGFGVLDNSTTETVLSLATVSSGSRWDLVCARRNWGTNATSFAVVTGSATRALPGRAQTPGTLDEQPIALARVQAGQSQVAEIVDLRVWGGDGGIFATDPLVLQYLNRVGTSVRIAGVDWRRVLDMYDNPTWVSSPTAAGSVTPTAGANYNLSANGLYTRDGFLFGAIGFTRRSGVLAHGDVILTLPAAVAPDFSVNTSGITTPSPAQFQDFAVSPDGKVSVLLPPGGRTSGEIRFNIPIRQQ